MLNHLPFLQQFQQVAWAAKSRRLAYGAGRNGVVAEIVGRDCAQIKDPQRNGERTLEDVAAHVRDDPLVGWGWHPGGGREPAPGSAEQTYRAIEQWAAAGAPCPSD